MMLGFGPLTDALAQDASAAAGAEDVSSETVSEVSPADAEFDKRLELAKEMHQISPSADQVNLAIDAIAERMPAHQRDGFRTALRRVINYRVIEKASIDAMVETFNVEELETLVEYNRRPIVKEIQKKQIAYEEKLRPEIIRMLDKAMMRVRTGAVQ